MNLQKWIPRAPRRRRASISTPTSTEIPPFQRLPGEIVELILEHYMLILSSFPPPSFHYEGHEDSRDRFKWSRGWQTVFNVQKHVVAIRDSKRSPLNILLVCRLWYFAGLKHLYTHPLVQSSQRAIGLRDVLERHSQWQIAQDLTFIYDDMISERFEAFLTILRCSTSLDTLTVIQQYKLDMSPFDRHLGAMEDLTTRLRVITLYGGHDWSKVLKLSFPALEHFRLQYLSAPDEDILTGEMPNLRSLQLVQTKFQFTNAFFLRLGALPNLHTLELYLTDHKPLDMFSIHASGVLPNIQHLVVGVLDGLSSIRFGIWIPPPKLVSFTILVNLTSQENPAGSSVIADIEKNGIIRTMDRLKFLLSDKLLYRHSLERLTVVTQHSFGRSITGQDVVENARRDYEDFFKRDQAKDIEQAALDYSLFLARARRIMKFPTQAIWCSES